MKRIGILMLVMVTLLSMIQATFAVMIARAETNAIQLVDEKFLNLSYRCEKLKESNQWVVNFNRQSQEEGYHQRLKIRISDEQNQTIEYSEITGMTEKDGWLTEKEFSVKEEGQLKFDLSKSIKKLNLYVQIDQQKAIKADNEHELKIEENILDRKEPFVLETHQAANKETTTSSEKVDIKEEVGKTTISSEKFVGPKKEKQKNNSIVTAAANRMYAALYENKVTEYNPDGGRHPKFSWQPDGQTNVINHQGGVAGKAGWDGETSWNVASDNYSKSYINYGDGDSNSNIQIRKYAQETSDPEKFKIKLNVKGNTTYKPGVDIVFLLDNSQSMESTTGLATGEALRKTNANLALQKIVDELKKTNEPAAENIRIGAEIFSDYSRYQSWGGGSDPKQTRTFKLSKNTADWDKMVSEYTKATPGGVTFTQRGLQEARDIFDASPSPDRHKLLFVLTDGAPNRSWETNDSGTPNLDMYPDQRYFTNFVKGTKGNYNGGKSLNSNTEKMTTAINPPYKNVITSHMTTTNSTAMDLKNAGIEIHTIALKLMVHPEEPSGSRDKQIRGLYKMSTKKANATNGPNEDVASDFHFYDVSNGDDLTEYFKNWYNTIIRTVDKGVITDPLGEMVELVGEPTWSQVNNGNPQIERLDEPEISVENNRRLIKVNNINLSKNQEIQLEYTVRLKTTDSSFESGKWYQANGETFLEPTPERTTDKLEFGIPSVKFKKDDFVIPVEKVWSDKHQGTENYWEMRPEKITATLQKQDESDWVDLESIDLDKDHEWKGNFSPVGGGTEHTYRVIESDRINGYKQASVNQSSFTSETLAAGGVKITNELLRGDYSFWKFMGDGTTKFDSDLPKFQVKREDGKILVENLTPDNSGKVTVNGLPIGNYIVEETYVPQGFQKMTNFTVNVTENNPPTSLLFEVNNNSGDYHVSNQLKDFSLSVEKVDMDDGQLEGATFKLTGPNYEETKFNGPIFSFANLRPGIYTLTETDNPNGYERIREPIIFEIKVDGSVAISDHPNASGSGGINGGRNTIDLKVTNKKVKEGVLPRTGAFGIRGFFLAAGILVIAGVLLSTTSLYLNRRKN